MLCRRRTEVVPPHASLHATLILFMTLPAQIPSAVYALGTVCCWGVSDFLGGYTSRRFNSFFLAMLGHAGGFSLVLGIATGNHLPVPPAHSMYWAMLAGASGGTA